LTHSVVFLGGERACTGWFCPLLNSRFLLPIVSVPPIRRFLACVLETARLPPLPPPRKVDSPGENRPRVCAALPPPNLFGMHGRRRATVVSGELPMISHCVFFRQEPSGDSRLDVLRNLVPPRRGPFFFSPSCAW